MNLAEMKTAAADAHKTEAVMIAVATEAYYAGTISFAALKEAETKASDYFIARLDWIEARA